jgi:hypothetical protein
MYGLLIENRDEDGMKEIDNLFGEAQPAKSVVTLMTDKDIESMGGEVVYG